MALLEVKNLEVNFKTHESVVHAVNGISFEIEKGETLGLVGETGAGKTTTAMSVLRLLPERTGEYAGGEILFEGEDLLHMSEKQLQNIRGHRISMIFQDPMTALNPIMPVIDQIEECVEIHGNYSAAEVKQKARDILEMVGIPADRGKEYPHQFSGGMKQRVVIAMALVCSPDLLLADEPTTALDVTIQAQILEMIQDLKKKYDTSMLLITHDLGVVADTCDRVAIMYAGELVEYGSLEDIFERTAHPYTRGLFDSLPTLDARIHRLKPIPGMMPDPADLPEGCKFHPRCPYATKECETSCPDSREIGPRHYVRCWHDLLEGEQNNGQ